MERDGVDRQRIWVEEWKTKSESLPVPAQEWALHTTYLDSSHSRRRKKAVKNGDSHATALCIMGPGSVVTMVSVHTIFY